MSAAQHRHMAGFTLVELLVALAVIAIALGTLVQAGVSQSRNATYLSERTYTLWVAENVIARIRTDSSLTADGARSGSEEMAGVEWPWRLQVSPTGNGTIRRIEVAVYRPDVDSDPITTLVAHLRAPTGARP